MTHEQFEEWLDKKIAEAIKGEPKAAGIDRDYFDGRRTALESVKAKFRGILPPPTTLS